MRFSKKLIAMCLAVAMLFTLSMTSTLAVSFSDVPNDSTYKTAIDSLVSLGLIVGYDDGTFRPNATITRAEFAAVMTRAMGQEEVALSGVNSRDLFTDMVVEYGQDHWATGYVRVAYNLGIILGMGDGTFAPDAPVTYEQAVKMVVCALGYEPVCVDRGGWPDGYLAVANEIGVTKSAVMQPTSQEAPRGMVAKLLYNSLNINMMERNSNGNSSLTTKTLLSSKLKVTELRNVMVVDVDGVATLNPGTSTVREGELILEGISSDSATYSYDAVLSSVEARKLLGYYVNCYYRYDETLDKRILVSIDATQYKNSSTTVMSDSIDSFSTGNRVLSYFENESDFKTKNLTISADAKLVYNGVPFDYKLNSNPSDMWNLSYWLSPESPNFLSGEAVFLDAGADGTVDVVFLYNYQTFVVKEPVSTTNPVDANNYVIYDAYVSGRSIRMDPTDPDVNLSIINVADNSEMKIEYLQANDVLSVAESMDSKTYICYVSKNTISGSVSEVSSDGHYVINNKEYKTTPEFRSALTSGSVVLDLDSTGTFYLDRFGRIAGAKVTSQQVGNYAYIASAREADNMDAGLSLYLMIPGNSQAVPMRTAERVRINGVNYTESSDMLKALSDVARLYDSNAMAGVNNAACTQMVRYAVNSSNRITSITTVAVSNGSLNLGINENNSTLKLNAQVDEMKYRAANNFSGVMLDSSTKIIAVPNGRREYTEYKTLTASSFKVGKSYQVEAYNVDSYGIADVLVVYGDIGSVGVSEDTPLSIIASDVSVETSSKLNPDSGVSVYSVQVYQYGTSGIVTYETDSTDSIYRLKAGDVVRLGFNNYGQINEVKVSAQVNNLIPKIEEEVSMPGGDYYFRTMVGTVVTKTNQFFAVTPAFVDSSVDPATLDESGKENMNFTNTTQFYMVSAAPGGGSTKQVTLMDNHNFISSFNDFAAGASKVLTYQYEGDLEMVVVYVD